LTNLTSAWMMFGPSVASQSIDLGEPSPGVVIAQRKILSALRMLVVLQRLASSSAAHSTEIKQVMCDAPEVQDQIFPTGLLQAMLRSACCGVALCSSRPQSQMVAYDLYTCVSYKLQSSCERRYLTIQSAACFELAPASACDIKTAL